MVDAAATPNLAAIGWTIAGAIVTASLSVIGKIVFDIYSKWSEHRADCRSLAAALAGEIGGYLIALNPEVAAPNYRALAALDREARVRKLAIVSVLVVEIC